jgi:four helix bundle protein
MASAKRFQDVEIWQLAHKWVLEIYRMTSGFPKQESFGLTSQLRRAAVSVPANFAEGFRKKGTADKLRYYNIAQGSISECMYYLVLAKDLGYCDTSNAMSELTRIDVMLASYVRSIQERSE